MLPKKLQRLPLPRLPDSAHWKLPRKLRERNEAIRRERERYAEEQEQNKAEQEANAQKAREEKDRLAKEHREHCARLAISTERLRDLWIIHTEVPLEGATLQEFRELNQSTGAEFQVMLLDCRESLKRVIQDDDESASRDLLNSAQQLVDQTQTFEEESISAWKIDSVDQLKQLLDGTIQSTLQLMEKMGSIQGLSEEEVTLLNIASELLDVLRKDSLSIEDKAREEGAQRKASVVEKLGTVHSDQMKRLLKDQEAEMELYPQFAHLLRPQHQKQKLELKLQQLKERYDLERMVKKTSFFNEETIKQMLMRKAGIAKGNLTAQKQQQQTEAKPKKTQWKKMTKIRAISKMSNSRKPEVIDHSAARSKVREMGMSVTLPDPGPLKDDELDTDDMTMSAPIRKKTKRNTRGAGARNNHTKKFRGAISKVKAKISAWGSLSKSRSTNLSPTQSTPQNGYAPEPTITKTKAPKGKEKRPAGWLESVSEASTSDESYTPGINEDTDTAKVKQSSIGSKSEDEESASELSESTKTRKTGHSKKKKSKTTKKKKRRKRKRSSDSTGDESDTDDETSEDSPSDSSSESSSETESSEAEQSEDESSFDAEEAKTKLANKAKKILQPKASPEVSYPTTKADATVPLAERPLVDTAEVKSRDRKAPNKQMEEKPPAESKVPDNDGSASQKEDTGELGADPSDEEDEESTNALRVALMKYFEINFPPGRDKWLRTSSVIDRQFIGKELFSTTSQQASIKPR